MMCVCVCACVCVCVCVCVYNGLVLCGPMVWSSIDPLWSNGPGPQVVQWSGSDSSGGALCAPRVLYWLSFKLSGAQAEPLDSLVAQSASGKDQIRILRAVKNL